MTYILSLYEIDRAYGGPEEGGWWYDCGELRRTVRVFRDKSKAYAAACRANGWLRRLQSDRPRVSSVIYHGGRFAAEVHQDAAPAHYPETRPHYE